MAAAGHIAAIFVITSSANGRAWIWAGIGVHRGNACGRIGSSGRVCDLYATARQQGERLQMTTHESPGESERRACR
ncbi:hypothetical protein FB45DRAFT_951883, partial [Roridomyces roridus]